MRDLDVVAMLPSGRALYDAARDSWQRGVIGSPDLPWEELSEEERDGWGLLRHAGTPVQGAADEAAWAERVARLLRIHFGLIDDELCTATARFLVREKWLLEGRPGLEGRHVLLIAKAVAMGTVPGGTARVVKRPA